MKSTTYLIRRSYCVILLLLLTNLLANAQQVPRGLTSSSNGEFIGFYEYTPVNYNANPTTKYPLIIFLHGIGERGNGTSELPNVLGQAIPKYISQGNTMTFYWNGQWETFLVLSPQLSRNYGDWQNFYVEEMLKYAKSNLRVDTNRIFLTGLSLGGGGVWKYASSSLANARKFAGIAPVCGTCAMSNACNIAQANLPVWAFHANDDGIVGPGCTTSSVQSINTCNPGVSALTTLYNDGGHFIWDRAYDMSYNWQDPHLFEWMLGQSRTYPVNNTPPIANAGADIVITHPVTSTLLNASASSDADGTIARYTWKKLSGPTGGIIQNPGAAVTNLTGLMSTGNYRFEIMVVDNRAIARRDTVQVTVNQGPPGTNLPPVAVAGPDQVVTVNAATITSWGSFDVDGGIVAYLWTKLSGPDQYTLPNNTYNTAGITNMAAGVYLFELRITDNDGGIGRDTVQITVDLNGGPPPPPANQAPVANAGTDQSINLPVNNTTLNGSGSTDSDGSITSYSWSKIGGPTSFSLSNPNATSPTVTNLTAGTYVFRLQVTDNAGASSSDTMLVVVNAIPPPPPGNQAPLANAGNDITIDLPTNNTTLDGSGSTDPDGTITNYFWTKISGPAQFSIGNTAAASTTLTGLSQGVYRFVLEVTDNSGSVSADTIVVTVNASPSLNLLPFAKAGADISITLPSNSTNLNGWDSYDPDGTVVAYSWVKISGPSQYNLASPTVGLTALANLVQGTYSFSLTVTDNQGASSIDTVQVFVSNAPPPPNQVPVANAGNDISIILPTNSTNLNGSLSADPDGSIVSFNWIKIAGPTQFSFGNPNSATTTLSNLILGSYSFRLVVTDNSGAIASDTISVTVNAAPPPPNQLPNAIAGTNIVLTLPTNTATLDGTGSNDPDGSIVNYSWSKISGPAQFNLTNPTSASTPISNLVEGTYIFRLEVTDNNGATDIDSITVLVNPPIPPPPPANQAPNANAGVDLTITLPTNNVILNASGSSDPDGSIISYVWSKIAGPGQFNIINPTASTTNVENLIQGIYSFQLIVTDNNGATDYDTVNITVGSAPLPTNQLPIANAGADFNAQIPNSNIRLDGTASRDPDGTIVGYSWVRISGPGAITIVNSTSATPTLAGLQVGEYVFELTVTDNAGAIATDQVKLTTSAAPNLKPVANAGIDTAIAFPNSTAILNGSGSYDSDGNITSYSWRQLSGPSISTISNNSLSITAVTGLVTGIYQYELKVTDNKGDNHKDTVSITVVDNARYEESLLVYPNPSSGAINIRFVSDTVGIGRICMFDMTGHIVRSITIDKARQFYEIHTDISGLKAGVYVLEITIGQRKRMITRFIKQ